MDLYPALLFVYAAAILSTAAFLLRKQFKEELTLNRRRREKVDAYLAGRDAPTMVIPSAEETAASVERFKAAVRRARELL